jgi:hypothetical protein
MKIATHVELLHLNMCRNACMQRSSRAWSATRALRLRWPATFTARKTISTRRVSPPPGCPATFDLKVGHDWNTRWSPTLLIGVTD